MGGTDQAIAMGRAVDDGEFGHPRVLHVWLARKARPAFSEFVTKLRYSGKKSH
jgi:hypothetical protein